MVIDINGKAFKVDVADAKSIEDAINRLQEANVLLEEEISQLSKRYSNSLAEISYFDGQVEEAKLRIKLNENLIVDLKSMKEDLEHQK